MRARTPAAPPSMYGKTGSFLKESNAQRNGGGGGLGGGRFGWLVVAIVLGAILGGLAAMAGSCKRDAGAAGSAGEVQMLQSQIDKLIAQNTQLQSSLKQCGGGDATGALQTLPATSTPMDTSYYVAERTEVDLELKAALEALNLGPSGRKEVLVAVSNNALINDEGTDGMLATWIEQVKASGVENALVVCLDDDIEKAMKKIGFPHWRFRAKVHNLDKNLDNHGISGQKFMILREFLMLGFSPLLSDVDIVTLKNPFDYLERDSDVEGMTDGFDSMAYMRLEVRSWTHNFKPHKDSVAHMLACLMMISPHTNTYAWCRLHKADSSATFWTRASITTGNRRSGNGMVSVRAVVANLLDEFGSLLPPSEREDHQSNGDDHESPSTGEDVGPVCLQLLRPATILARFQGLRRVSPHHGLRALHEHEAFVQVSPPPTPVQLFGSSYGARELPPGQVGEDEGHYQVEESRRRFGAEKVPGWELLQSS